MRLFLFLFLTLLAMNIFSHEKPYHTEICYRDDELFSTMVIENQDDPLASLYIGPYLFDVLQKNCEHNLWECIFFQELVPFEEVSIPCFAYLHGSHYEYSCVFGNRFHFFLRRAKTHYASHRAVFGMEYHHFGYTIISDYCEIQN